MPQTNFLERSSQNLSLVRKSFIKNFQNTCENLSDFGWILLYFFSEMIFPILSLHASQVLQGMFPVFPIDIPPWNAMEWKPSLQTISRDYHRKNIEGTNISRQS